MNIKSVLRLCTTAKCTFPKNCRFYSKNRNMLKLHERGLYQDLFPETSADEIVDLCKKSPQCVYAGFDPTANSLHIGNLLVLINLLHWQRSGHQVIVLIGGATGMIGDPSFRTAERAEMNKPVLEENIVGIKENIQTLFKNHEQFIWKDSMTRTELKPVIFLNNIDWYLNWNVVDFVNVIGKHFRLGTMLGRSSVESRIKSETGMSFKEFTYPIFQAYDWSYLMKKYNCYFQIGGNDQMGNIISGYDLIGKLYDKRVYGLTLPLLTAEGGKKFGKSVKNAIWLSPNKSSSFEFYQYFMRTTDSDVERFLKLFTFLPLQNIRHIMERHEKAPEQHEAQKLLAEHITLLVHGENGLKTAKQVTSLLYEKSIKTLSKLSANELVQAFDGANLVELLPKPGLTVYQLVTKVKCFETDNDALRIISAGGFSINYQKITNANEVLSPGIHILSNNITLIRVGKKTYHVVKWLA